MHWSHKKVFILLLLSLAAFCVHAQDTSWTIVKADHVFSVSMPRDFKKTDSSLKSPDGVISYTTLQLWDGAVSIRIMRGESLKKAMGEKAAVLSGIEYELRESGRNLGYTPIFLDTVISNVKGLEGLLYKEDDVMKRAYCFFVEGKFYSIFYSRANPLLHEHYEDFQRMLGSMHFSSPEATDTSEVVTIVQPAQENNKEGLSGELIACIVLVIIIVGVILYLKLRN
jgi:hypothetical protein